MPSGNTREDIEKLNALSLRTSLSDLARAIEIAEIAIARAEAAGHKDLLANALRLKGQAIQSQGNYNDDLVWLRRAAELAGDVGDSRTAALAYRNISAHYTNSFAPDLALEALQTSKNFAENLDEPAIHGIIHIQMANIMTTLEQYDNALDNYLLALDYFTQAGQMSLANTTRMSIGSNYLGREDWTSAIRWLSQANKEAEQLGDINSLRYGLQTIALVQAETGDYSLAKASMSQALELAHQVQDMQAVAGVKNSWAAMALEHSIDLKSARQLASESLQWYRQASLERQTASALNTLGRIEGALGNYESAWALIQEELLLRDKLFEEGLQERSSALLAQLNVAEKELAVQRLEREAEVRELQISVERQRATLYLLTATVLTLLTLGLAIVFWQKVRTNKALTEANRQKSAVLANVSHEIRSPINAIVGMTDLLKRQEKNKKNSDYITAIQYSGQMLLRIVNDILDLAKANQGKLEVRMSTFDLPALIRQKELIWCYIVESKGLKFNIHIADNVTRFVVGAENRLDQILTNLITNGAKYTSDGHVTLRIENLSDQTNTDKILIAFSVEDSGAGIEKHEVRQIFERFNRLERDVESNIEGAGLGLSICSTLVHAMDGKISIESEKGKGSRFTVTIPFQYGEAPEELDKKSTVSGKRTIKSVHGLNILVVEDDPVQQRLMDAYMELLGAHATVVSSGEKALHTAERNDFNLVIIDGQLPDMSGFEIAKILQGSPKRDQQVIVGLSANTESEFRQRANACGMDGYLTKPISLEKLGKLLQDAAEKLSD